MLSPEAAIEAWIDSWLDSVHVHPRHYDRESLAREALAKARTGVAPAVVRRFVEDELSKATWGFAPEMARHDGRTRYRLPIDGQIPRCVVGAVGSEPTHTDEGNYYGFDYAAPRGTPVLAARPGVVARVLDGYAEGIAHANRGGNSVMILHEDGTWAHYGHLAPGIEIEEGASVRTGQRIARSGNTGRNSPVPHLHFGVLRMVAGRHSSLPIRFEDGSASGYVPQQYSCYGGSSPGDLRLTATFEGLAVEPRTAVPIPKGGAGQLRVQRVPAAGPTVDVTDHPSTRFDSLALWSLRVDERGRVEARATEEFEKFEEYGNVGQVYVRYGKGPPSQRGELVVHFQIDR